MFRAWRQPCSQQGPRKTLGPRGGGCCVRPDGHGWKARHGHRQEGNGDSGRVGGRESHSLLSSLTTSCQGPPRAVLPPWTQGAQSLSPRRNAAREHSTPEARSRGPCTIAPASRDTPRQGAHHVTRAERSAPWELAKPTASGDSHGRGDPPAIGLGRPCPRGLSFAVQRRPLGVGGSPQPQSYVAGRPPTRPS